MNWLEYLVATAMLRWMRLVFSILPIRRDRVVLASARHAKLEGNLRHLYAALRRARPDLEVVLLLEPYSYQFFGKLVYLLRLTRGMYFLCTSRLFVVDNAYFPIHVAPHRRGTTVVQVWHAAGALKRFGLATAVPPRQPERRFLHRHYDYVVASSEHTRTAYSVAMRTPIERVLPLGSPRTDLFFDEAAVADARRRLLERHPNLEGRRVVLYAPTFRGRGERKRAAPGLDAERLRALLPDDHALVLKAHPNLHRGRSGRRGYDAIIDPASEINDVFTITDILITDYSSVVFDWALLRRPLVLLTADLAGYEADPGLFLDYRTEMIGTQVVDTEGVAEAIRDDAFDIDAYDAFIDRHLGTARGDASTRFVDRFVRGLPVGGARLRPDVSDD
jgi:CDP-glycerol glycerophosphotransferase (TagB/SpsB family)